MEYRSGRGYARRREERVRRGSVIKSIINSGICVRVYMLYT